MNELARTNKNDIRSLLQSPETKKQIEIACAKHLDADRLIRVMLTGIQKTPTLLECTPGSLVMCALESAQLGLEPDGVLGHAYLVPFRKDGVRQAQFMIGYRGMIDLFRRSGFGSNIYAEAVYENDKFEVVRGLHPDLIHVPDYDSPERGAFRGAYAVATMKDGTAQFDYMPKRDIDKIKNTSKAGTKPGTPWHDWYEEMAKKTVIRKLFKMLPCSVEIQRAVNMDELRELGIIKGQDYDADITSSEVEPGMPDDLNALVDRDDPHDAETGEVVPEGGETSPELDSTQESLVSRLLLMSPTNKVLDSMCKKVGVKDASQTPVDEMIGGLDGEQCDKLSLLLDEAEANTAT